MSILMIGEIVLKKFFLAPQNLEKLDAKSVLIKVVKNDWSRVKSGCNISVGLQRKCKEQCNGHCLDLGLVCRSELKMPKGHK